MNFFSEPSPLPFLLCSRCRGAGMIGMLPCGECAGMRAGAVIGNRFAYYGESLTPYRIKRRRARHVLHTAERLISAFFAFGLLFFSLWLFVRQEIVSFRYIFFAFVFICFSIYRLMAIGRTRAPFPQDEKTSLLPVPRDWKDARRIPRRARVDIALRYALIARRTIEKAVLRAEKDRSESVDPVYLFEALLDVPDVRNMFLRLGVLPQTIVRKTSALHREVRNARHPHLSNDLFQILFHAYDAGRQAKGVAVGPADLLIATVEQSHPLQEMLYDLSIDAKKLENVAGWIRIRERLREMRRRWHRVGSHRSRSGIDRAMTAVATPFLNAYSDDMTSAARDGYLLPSAPRGKLIEEIFQNIEAGKRCILLVGDPGVGKMTIIEDIALRMIGDAAPRALHDKRLVRLSSSSLLAGVTISGAQERLIHMMAEIARAGNVALCIHNVHDLMSANGAQGSSGLDVAETLAEYGGRGNGIIFATTTPQGYAEQIVRSELGSLFESVHVEEMNVEEAIQALESRVGVVEFREKVFFSYEALSAAATLAKRYLRDHSLPASALELMAEAGSAVRSKRGEHQLVTREDVSAIVEKKTGIPKTSISENESEKLLALEAALHERVVGQDEAVAMVANALRRSRADIRSGTRPIACFLFVGPSGVGKTELAKTVAETYFGGEHHMIRLDMSEFQDTRALYRLIGEPGHQGTGMLSEPVREHPFSLTLLDEFEKASPDILNLFLQVFDDGRLTDGSARVIDFTNTIIIATSNAGTNFIEDAMARGASLSEIQEALLSDELRKFFRPELLNRFDGIVVFHPLQKEEIKKIASLMLKRVARDLEARGVGLRFEEDALSELADIGFDQKYGARTLRRAIQDRVENRIADIVLRGELKRRDTIAIQKGLIISVEHP